MPVQAWLRGPLRRATCDLLLGREAEQRQGALERIKLGILQAVARPVGFKAHTGFEIARHCAGFRENTSARSRAWPWRCLASSGVAVATGRRPSVRATHHRAALFPDAIQSDSARSIG